MKREASVATLKRVAEAVDPWYGHDSEDEPDPGWCEESKALFEAVRVYRAEIAPLPACPPDPPSPTSEPPYGATGAAAKESREDIAAPVGATSAASVALELEAVKMSLAHAHRRIEALEGAGGDACGVPEAPGTCDWCDDSAGPALHRHVTPERVEWVCRRCLEERGKAPAHPDDRPCGCEEAETLRQQARDAEGRYQQVVELNHANELAYLKKTDALQQQLEQANDRIREFCRIFNGAHDIAMRLKQLTDIGP